jgi:predicted GNAT superfamily acetyltransferase
VQEPPQQSPPPAGSDGIVLRPLASLGDYDAAVELQDEIWGAGFSDRVPASILRVAQKVGGVSAGAFDAAGHMLGFVFGLTGVREGTLVHWSDMLAVREGARGQRLGERLKLYQRDIVRAMGVEKMFWTFDPLVARNAHFNLNRLGASIADYVPNFYGANTGSILHGALPTDRFVAEWSMRADAGTGAGRGRDTATRASNDAPVTTVVRGADVRNVTPFPDAPRVLVPIPPDIEPVLLSHPDDALAWRLATREAMMHYLARGYRVTGFHRGDGRALPAYELTSSSSNPA